MAKSFKFCADCQCTHAKGDCSSAEQDRRVDHKRRERVRAAEQYQFDYSDPLAFDP